MKRTVLTVDEALEQGKSMSYAYIARLSSVYVGPMPQVLPLEELTEARLFGEDGEIRIWKTEDVYAACLLEDGGSNYIDRESPVISPKFGKKITKRQYLAFDEDGQGYVAATRLLRWEG